MRRIYKLHFRSNRRARQAAWDLRQLPVVRLGCCTVVFSSSVTFNAYLANVLAVRGGYYENRDTLTAFDVNEIRQARRNH